MLILPCVPKSEFSVLVFPIKASDRIKVRTMVAGIHVDFEKAPKIVVSHQLPEIVAAEKSGGLEMDIPNKMVAGVKHEFNLQRIVSVSASKRKQKIGRLVTVTSPTGKTLKVIANGAGQFSFVPKEIGQYSFTATYSGIRVTKHAKTVAYGAYIKNMRKQSLTELNQLEIVRRKYKKAQYALPSNRFRFWDHLFIEYGGIRFAAYAVIQFRTENPAPALGKFNPDYEKVIKHATTLLAASIVNQQRGIKRAQQKMLEDTTKTQDSETAHDMLKTFGKVGFSPEAVLKVATTLPKSTTKIGVREYLGKTVSQPKKGKKELIVFVNDRKHQMNLENLARVYREITGKRMRYVKILPEVGIDKKVGKYIQLHVIPTNNPSGTTNVGVPMEVVGYAKNRFFTHPLYIVTR